MPAKKQKSAYSVGKTRISRMLLIFMCAVFLSAAVIAADAPLLATDGAFVSCSVNNAGRIEVKSASQTAKPYLFILVTVDEDGRLDGLHIESDKTVGADSPALLDIDAGEDARLVLDPSDAADAAFVGTLYAFDENLSPAAAPVKVYSAAKSCFIDSSYLFE